MDDQQTTTDDVVDTGAQEEALPVETSQEDSAAEATSEQATEQASDEGEETTSLPEVDDKLQKFADSHGLTLDNESAIKAAKIAMDNQAGYQKSRQKASELEKSMQSMSEQEVQQYELQSGVALSDTERMVRKLYVRDTVRTFYESNPDARNYERQMAQIVQERPHLAGDLDAIYAIARSQDVESLKSQGGKEALQSLASKQRASSPTGSAVSSAPKSSKITRAQINERLQAGDTAWYEQNLAQINKQIQDGTL